MSAKILILDLETAPKLAYVWKFFKENVSPKQVKEHGHIMSYAAKWLGEPAIYYEDNRKEDDHVIVGSLCALLDQADIVVAHNGGRFDIPQIRARALVHNIKPPSPVKIIDTCLLARRIFNFPANSLEYLAKVLDLKTQKGGHGEYPGFTLWLACLKGDEKAWAEMKEYNIRDVIVLEELYLRMRPWMTNHPNVAVYESQAELDKPVCPKCSSTHVQLRGSAYTSVGRFQRFQCQSCGGWAKTRYSLDKKNENILGNA